MKKYSDKLKKGIYIILGILSLLIGFIGIFLPVVPTTPFILLSAACFLRGSKRLHTWIINHGRFGEIVRNYQSGKGIKKNTKIKAITLMWFTVLISMYYFIDNYLIKISLVIIILGVSVYILRLPTIPE